MHFFLGLGNMEDGKEDRRTINISLDKRIFEIIELLGKNDSFDADLVDLLLEALKVRLQSLDEKIQNILEAYLKGLEDLDKDFTEFNYKEIPLKKGKGIFNKKNALLKIFNELLIKKKRIESTDEKNKRLNERVNKLSKILSKGTNISAEDFNRKLKDLIEKNPNTFNPLSYEVLKLQFNDSNSK